MLRSHPPLESFYNIRHPSRTASDSDPTLTGKNFVPEPRVHDQRDRQSVLQGVHSVSVPCRFVRHPSVATTSGPENFVLVSVASQEINSWSVAT